MCQACGSEQSRWQGQCPDCAEWNTLVQENAVVSVFSARHDLSSGGRAVELVGLDAEIALPERIKTGIAEFDRAPARRQIVPRRKNRHHRAFLDERVPLGAVGALPLPPALLRPAGLAHVSRLGFRHDVSLAATLSAAKAQ